MNFGSMKLGILRNGGILGGGGAPDITEFGDGIAIENTVQYFTSGFQQITHMNARNLSGQCLISRRLGSSAAPHFHLIDNAITQVWVMSSANLSAASNAGRAAGTYIDESATYVYTAVSPTDGVTYGSFEGRLIPMRLSMADGSQNWVSESTVASGGEGFEGTSVNCVDVDEANNRMFFDSGSSGDALKQHVASTGAEASVSGNEDSLGSAVAAGCLTPDKTKFVALGVGETPEVAMWPNPLTSVGQNWTGYSTNQLKLDGTHTTNDFVYAAIREYGGRVVPARDGTNHVYLSMGFHSLSNTRFIGRMNPDSGSYGAITNERDVATDAAFTPGTHNPVLDIQADKFGDVYALVANTVTTGGSGLIGKEWDIVRYKPDLTEPFSFVTDGGVTMPAMSTYGYVTRLAVDEAGSVFVGTRTGYVIRFSQT